EADRESAFGRGVQEERQVSEYFLVNDARPRRPGDRLAIDEDRPGPVAFLDDAYRGGVAFLVEQELARFVDRPLVEAANGDARQEHARRQQNGAADDEAFASGRATRHAPGDAADDEHR